jgi:predicted oxidoreductase (fatty acid repression mutant protein)
MLFNLDSSGESFWGVDLNALSDDELRCMAQVGRMKLVKRGIYSIREVRHIPTGAKRFSDIFIKENPTYFNSASPRVLIIDDVLTTGFSMWEKRLEVANELEKTHRGSSWKDTVGLVIFSRDETPTWITTIWQY